MDEYFCPNCDAILNEQSGFDPLLGAWKCQECGQILMDDDVYNGDVFTGVAWYCDCCESLLNKQVGFSDCLGIWECTECGYVNDISEENIFDDNDQIKKDYSNDTYQVNSRILTKNHKFRSSIKIIKAVMVTLIIVIAFLTFGHIGWKIYQVSKLTEIGVNSKMVLGQKYESVVTQLVEAGFKNIETIPVEELTLQEKDKINTVKKIEIDGKNVFKADDEFSCDTAIFVYYSVIAPISPPTSSKECKGENYRKIQYEFEKVGFVNIKIKAVYDIVFGWFAKDGEVESVKVGDETKFDTEDLYDPEVEVIITYHTYKKNSK